MSSPSSSLELLPYLTPNSADALGDTGQGAGNYLMALGIIETVAIFVLVFVAIGINGASLFLGYTNFIIEHTTPDDPIFVVPWASGFYFLTDRRNPTRTDFLLFEDPESYPCLLARLDERPPTYVIYGYTWDVDGRRFRDYAAPIDGYIRSRYALEDSVDGYEIWRRLDGLPAPAEPWPGACAPRRFRWRDLTASSVQ